MIGYKIPPQVTQNTADFLHKAGVIPAIHAQVAEIDRYQAAVTA